MPASVDLLAREREMTRRIPLDAEHDEIDGVEFGVGQALAVEAVGLDRL